MRRNLPAWCKEAKIAMINQDLGTEELAVKLNLTRPYVSSILNGRVRSPAAMKKISDFLQIPNAEDN